MPHMGNPPTPLSEAPKCPAAWIGPQSHLVHMVTDHRSLLLIPLDIANEITPNMLVVCCAAGPTRGLH